MPDIYFESEQLSLLENESVLDCLLRHAKAIPYACKAGMCQACLIKTTEGSPPEAANKWVRQSLRDQGFALACQWVPDGDVGVALPSVEEFSVAVELSQLRPLNERTLQVILKAVEPGTMFASQPGQYLSLINSDGIARSYSIANDVEQDGHVELHISHAPDGLFSNWLFKQAKPGDQLHIRGPAGDCYYSSQDEDVDYPILLAGTGTGLAPLYGIVNRALRRGHQGPIHLYHGARIAEQLYYVDELQQLAAEHHNFTYAPCLLETDGKQHVTARSGDLGEIIVADVDSSTLAATRIFLCGNPDIVHRLRKQLFLQGARSSNIHSDPFLERNVGQINCT